MSFIQRELERVTTRLQAGPLPTKEYGELYAVQQALSWSLEPQSFKSPYDMLVPISTPEEPKDCLAESDRSPFSDNRDCRVS
jgi:hypothetical protein